MKKNDLIITAITSALTSAFNQCNDTANAAAAAAAAAAEIAENLIKLHASCDGEKLDFLNQAVKTATDLVEKSESENKKYLVACEHFSKNIEQFNSAAAAAESLGIKEIPELPTIPEFPKNDNAAILNAIKDAARAAFDAADSERFTDEFNAAANATYAADLKAARRAAEIRRLRAEISIVRQDLAAWKRLKMTGTPYADAQIRLTFLQDRLTANLAKEKEYSDRKDGARRGAAYARIKLANAVISTVNNEVN